MDIIVPFFLFQITAELLTWGGEVVAGSSGRVTWHLPWCWVKRRWQLGTPSLREDLRLRMLRCLVRGLLARVLRGQGSNPGGLRPCQGPRLHAELVESISGPLLLLRLS